MNRRALLKSLATAGATVAAAPVTALAKAPKRRPEGAVGLLYDATKCIGCKACMTACRENAGLDPADRDGLWDDPLNLNANAKNIIKLYKGEDGTESFMKMQCMQCVDPGCVSVCMLGALHKDGETGVVEYDAERCIGCRYCQVACPFNVPAFEWKSNTPQIVKCDLCKNRRDEGKVPACADVCPREAVIYGKYEDLLKDAKSRIAAQPNKYENKVYGETDGGGTQVLYLTSKQVSFASLGLPNLGEKSVPSLPEKIQHTIYKGFAAPVALYAVLGAVILRNRKRGHEEEAE